MRCASRVKFLKVKTNGVKRQRCSLFMGSNNNDYCGFLTSQINADVMFQIASRVCGLKTLQDLSCCYLLAAGSHWNPWNNKLNLFVPLPEAQSELLLFESCYSSGKFNLNFMWSSGGTFRGTETRPHSQGWSKEVSLWQCDTLQTRGADMMGGQEVIRPTMPVSGVRAGKSCQL